MANNTVTIYIQSSSSSSRKAKQWLEENGIPHIPLHLGRESISKEHLMQLLSQTENGFKDIVKRTQLHRITEDMSFNEVLEYLQEHSDMMKCPIMIQGNKSLVGYHIEEIGVFLPRSYRQEKLKQYYSVI